MINLVQKLFLRNYQPLNIIEISKKNLVHNYSYLSSINKRVKIAPVLKSNAYGHGLVVVAKILENKKPPFFCVDSLYEGYELLKNDIKTPILIMGFIDPLSLKTKYLPFSFVVFNLEQVESLNKYQPEAKIHIFVDTGMHREGIRLEEFSNFVEYIKTKTTLTIEGIMSHFGESENKENSLTKMQINNFRKVINSITPKWVHISNSGGILNNYALGNVGRCGIALYGISPGFPNNKLKPTFVLKTHIAQVKNLKKNESVGYSFTFKAKGDMKIAILPIGYNDGIDRRLSNKGFVTIGTTECKILGKISMNITTIDVTCVRDVKVGDEVTVFSNKRQNKNSIENAAVLSNTIPYDLLVGLNPSIKRIVR